MLRWGFIRELFSVHYCSSSCWRLCLENSGNEIAYGIASCRLSRFDDRIGGIVNGKFEEVEKRIEVKGLEVNAFRKLIIQLLLTLFLYLVPFFMEKEMYGCRLYRVK